MHKESSSEGALGKEFFKLKSITLFILKLILNNFIVEKLTLKYLKFKIILFYINIQIHKKKTRKIHWKMKNFYKIVSYK